MNYNVTSLYKRESTNQLVYIDSYISRSKNYKVYIVPMHHMTESHMVCSEAKHKKAYLDTIGLREVFDTELIEKFKKLFILKKEQEVKAANAKLAMNLRKLRNLKIVLSDIEKVIY